MPIALPLNDYDSLEITFSNGNLSLSQVTTIRLEKLRLKKIT